MTENKRFTLTDTAKITKDSLLTGINDTNRQLTVSELVDCLNALHEENQVLKKQNKRLHDDLHKVNQIARGY